MQVRELESKNFLLNYRQSVRKVEFPRGFYKHLEESLPVFRQFLQSSSGKGLGLSSKNIEGFQVNVHLVGDQKVRTLNRDYRNKDKTTDVLSFPMYENIRGGQEFLVGLVDIGDIVISSPVMHKQSREFKVTPEQEFLHLLVHGFLHLCGYDHDISSQEERVMEELEQHLIKKIYQKIYGVTNGSNVKN